MGYVVVEPFSDMQDGAFTYKPGDVFPRRGVSVSNGRLVELSTDKNKLGRALIKQVNVADAVPGTGTKSEAAKDTDELILAGTDASAEVAGTGDEPDPPQEPSKPRRGRKKKD